MTALVLSTDNPIPDGSYEGTWGGYVVRFSCGGMFHQGRTDKGIRTPSAPCVVTARNGQLTVETK